ncbi:MAG: outer membrane lipoprotein carrier protein LolA [Nitrospinota bacterium]|nr:outer membrane lipoprotein carrier protein LolA [Nitrospinota bacterium]
MTRICALVFCGAACTVGVALAADEAAQKENVPRKIQEAFDATAAMTARFTQVVKSKGFGEKREASGTVAIKKPGMMRWEYDEPSPLLIVADGEKLWYYDKSENIIYLEPMSGHLSSRSPAMFLAGDRPLAEIFDVTLSKAQAEEGARSLKLIPKEPWPGLKGALLKVDAKSFTIKGIMMVDHLGNRNTISFSDVDTKASPPPSMFQFTPPQGVKIQQAARTPTPSAPIQ